MKVVPLLCLLETNVIEFLISGKRYITFVKGFSIVNFKNKCMKSLNLIKNDPWLEPYREAIESRCQYAIDKEDALTGNGKQSLSDMASGYLYFGLHKIDNGWIFREWAPNAIDIYLIGTFNSWMKDEQYRLKSLKNGVWEIKLAEEMLHHGDLFKLLVEWNGGSGERIPA